MSNITGYYASTDPARRPATFLTGHGLDAHCYVAAPPAPGGEEGGDAAGEAQPELRLCPLRLPCNATLRTELGLGRCFLQLPAVPRTAYLHFVRNPISVVVSAYLFHTQLPAPEEWIDNFKVRHAQGPVRRRAGWWASAAHTPCECLTIAPPPLLHTHTHTHASRQGPWLAQNWMNAGVPQAVVERIGLPTLAADDSYGSILHRLPPQQGVKVEAWRAIPGGCPPMLSLSACEAPPLGACQGGGEAWGPALVAPPALAHPAPAACPGTNPHLCGCH